MLEHGVRLAFSFAESEADLRENRGRPTSRAGRGSCRAARRSGSTRSRCSVRAVTNSGRSQPPRTRAHRPPPARRGAAADHGHCMLECGGMRVCVRVHVNVRVVSVRATSDKYIIEFVFCWGKPSGGLGFLSTKKKNPPCLAAALVTQPAAPAARARRCAAAGLAHVRARPARAARRAAAVAAAGATRGCAAAAARRPPSR